MTRIVTLVLVALLASAAFAEDVIELESGRVLKGKITREEKAWIGLETGDGVVWLERSEIKTLTRESTGRRPLPAPVPAEETPPEPEDSAERVRESVKREVLGDRPAEGRTAPAGDTADPKKRTAEAERLLQALGSEDSARRHAASEWVADTWPKWREALMLALKTDSEPTRLEATRLLDDERITDPFAMVESALDDDSEKVRTAALRVARHRELNGIETRAIELMRTDPTWVVRQEAIRTLEDVGGTMCLPHVMSAWSGELEKDRRRRYRRVMKALLGEDFGDDTAAWYRAADELFMGTREIRKGKVKDPDDAR